MIPARITHLDAKGSTHAPPHRAVSFTTVLGIREMVGCDNWRLDNAFCLLITGNIHWIDVWLVNGQRVRVRPSAKWREARKEMFK